MFSGMAASTMSRDDTWRFYLLGRSVERVDMIGDAIKVAFAERAAPVLAPA